MKPWSKETMPAMLFLWLYAGVLLALFMTPSVTGFYYAGAPDVSTNVWHFYDDAGCLAKGNLPYGEGFARCVSEGRKVPPERATFEYPPLAGAYLWALGKAASGRDAFFMLFTAAAMVMFWACGRMVYGEAEAMRGAGGGDRRIAVWAALVMCSLAAGPVAVVSFDLLPAGLALGAFILLYRGRGAASAALLALSVAAKGYAVILLPLFVYEWWRGGGKGNAARMLAVFGGVCGAFAAAGLACSPSGFIKSFTYHSGRGLELNSVYAAAIIALRPLGTAPGKVFDHGSWNVTGGGVAGDIFLKYWPAFMLVLLCAATWAAWRNSSRTSVTDSAPGGAGYSAGLRWAVAVTAVFIVTFKVGSPQFLCWIAPFAALLVLEGEWAAVVLFVLAGHASTWVYPGEWASYVAGLHRIPAGVLLFEKACLLLMAALLVRPRFRQG